jgi:hypothetical protein
MQPSSQYPAPLGHPGRVKVVPGSAARLRCLLMPLACLVGSQQKRKETHIFL